VCSGMDSDLASGVVVMKIDDCTVRASRAVSSGLLTCVHERLAERDAVRDVVRTAGPLEAAGTQPRAAVARPSSLLSRRRRTGRDGPVTAAAIQLPGTARSGHGVDDAGRRDGVYERSLPCSCQCQ